MTEWLGGEERLQGALAYRAGHTHAGIGNANVQVAPGRQVQVTGLSHGEVAVCTSDAERTAQGHGIVGIDAQVQQSIFQLLRIDVN
ncbi:hypothetical protein D3C81_1960790 [compost metagenome]